MFIEKCEEYLNHYKITKADEKYLCEKGKVYFFGEKYSEYNSEALLSRAYFNITDVSIDAVEDSVKYFSVTLNWKGIKKQDSEKDYFVILYHGNRIEWDNIKTDLEYFGKPKKKFYQLCSEYLKQILVDYWQWYKEQPYIGWSRRGGEDSFKTFLGVNEYGDALKGRYPCLFNDEIELHNKKHDWQEGDFQELFEWVLGDYNSLGVFVYTLHALLFYYSGGMKNEMQSEEVFAICIYGRDMEKVKIIANLLSNLFEYSKEKMNILKRGSYFSCSSLEKQKAIFYRIESVPLIVCNKTGRLTRSSSIITSLRNQRLRGEIAYFPVFLSQNAINADEVLDFCVDDIPVRSDYPDWKTKLNYLLIQFIVYLEDMESNYYKKPNNAQRNILDDLYITEEKRLASQKDYMSCEEYSRRLLFVACGVFAGFLREEMQYLNIANSFLTITRDVFWKEALPKQKCTAAAKEADIKSFAAFVNITLQKEEQEREFLCVRRTEKNSGEVIYISYDEYYPHYKNYCQVNHMDCHEQTVILKSLKEKNMLKLRSNQKQYSLQKVLNFQGTKEKRTVLAIKEEAFRLCLNDG